MSRDNAIDFRAIAPDVARTLWGKENPRLSNKAELRFGNNGSVAVPLSGPKRGSFYDFEAGIGGGVLDMIRHRTGCANGAAVDWLKSHGFVAANNETQKHSGHREARRVAAVYIYSDANGKPLYRKLRYHRKTFSFERADGRGGWVSGRGALDGVQRTLYRLADLKRAPASTTIFVTEGEKAADSLADRLLVATAAGGATAWRPEFAEHLRGRRVVILPDNDGPGSAYAETAARSLAGIAQSIAILRLEGLAPGADVFDWLAAGGTAEELEALAAGAPAWQPGTADQPKPDADADVWDAGADDYNVPPRAWLLGTVFCRRFLSSVLADGGVGKTALRVAQLMSLAIGRSLTGERVHQRCRVLIVSLEDDRDELRRRVRAAMLHHHVDAEDLRGHLFLAAPKGLRLAEMQEGVPTLGALHKWLENAIATYRPDVISLDPFIKAHGLDENSNNAIDFVCTTLAKLAIAHDIAVDLPHHVSKGLSTAGDANRGRGASAMKDAARLVYTLTPMSPEEADSFGLSGAQRRSLIRLDSGKVNIAPPAASATWFELIGVQLGNATDAYPNGDSVQTVQPWAPPDTWADLTVPLLNAILDDLDAGLPDGSRYSPSPRQDVDRAAWRVVAKHAPDRTPEAAHKVIAAWLRTGLLTVAEYTDAGQRKARKGVSVVACKRPGTGS